MAKSVTRKFDGTMKNRAPSGERDGSGAKLFHELKLGGRLDYISS